MKFDCPHCGNLIEQQGRSVKKPGTKDIKLREFTGRILRDVYGIKGKAAISKAWKRHTGETKEILGILEGDIEEAYRATVEIGEYLERRGLDWTLSTVAAHLPDWIKYPKKYQPIKDQRPVQRCADCRGILPTVGGVMCRDCEMSRARERECPTCLKCGAPSGGKFYCGECR